MRRTISSLLLTGALALGLGPRAKAHDDLDGFPGAYGPGARFDDFGYGRRPGYGYGRPGHGYGRPGRHFCSRHRSWTCACAPLPPPPPPCVVPVRPYDRGVGYTRYEVIRREYRGYADPFAGLPW